MLPACSRFIFVSNHLPVRCARGETGWEFEWDEDALIAQAKVWLLSMAAHASKLFLLINGGTVSPQPLAATVGTTSHSGLGGPQCFALSAVHEPSRSSELGPAARAAVWWPGAGTGEDYMAAVPGVTEWNCCLVQEGVGEDLEVMFVGCLPVEIDFAEQEVGSISSGDGAPLRHVACFGVVQDVSQLVLAEVALLYPCCSAKLCTIH